MAQTKKKRARFVAKQYGTGCSNTYAVFKAGDVRSYKGVVPMHEGAVPFRGYEAMTKEHAECVIERLEREL